MNIGEIKKRRQDYLDSIKNYVEDKHEAKKEEFLYWAEQDIEYLLSIIEQAEKSLEKISKNAYLDHLGDVSLLMLQMSGNIADEALKAIRGN